MQGKRTLTDQDLVEVTDLYRWGARMSDLCILYDIHKQTIRLYMLRAGVPLRPKHRPTLASLRPHGSKGKHTRSSRPLIPEGAQYCADGQEPDQLLHSSARAQLDRRTAEHQQGASSRFCPAEAS